MNDQETDLQDQVNNAVADDSGSDADNEDLDDEEIDGGEGDTTSGSDDDTGEADTSDAGAAADSSATADDDEEDEEDPVGLAIMRSAMSGAPQDEQFDIRKLPRDENGLIDPDAANKAVQEWAQKRADAQGAESNSLNQVRGQLSGQWQKGSQDFPHIWKNRDLRDIALQIHLGSFDKARTGTGTYVSPAAALKKVDKMYNRAFKSGVSSQKIRRKVVATAGTERGSGTGSTAKNTEYAELKKQAASRDPAKAAEGRRKLIIYRRNARRANPVV